MDKLLSGRRVLVVEDEMLVLLSIEDMLADLGCDSVSAAANVDQAVALIDAQVFDAAMLDMNLNGHKSHFVADKLAERGVPFIFSTGYSGQDMRDGYRDRPVLKKPFQYEELVAILTRLLFRPSNDNDVVRSVGTRNPDHVEPGKENPGD
jgi:DNA-binding NtrC family response regulator